MERKMRYSVLAIAVAFMVSGCASPPAQELDAAKAGIQGVAAAGAEKYAPEELKKLTDQLSAANDEIKAQEGKWFKGYDKAKEMLVKIKADADNLKPTLAARKEHDLRRIGGPMSDPQSVENLLGALSPKKQPRAITARGSPLPLHRPPPP